jgi:hypothetical protein
VGAVAAFGVTTAVVAALAYLLIFSFSAEYDDEGYLLITLKMFGQGQALYDGVFSQYGPFYYAFMDGLRSVLRLEWSHDVGRFITVGLWTSTSLLCGLVIFALSRNLALGCVVQLLTALALDTLRYEPMHPGGLICLLVAGAATIPLLMPARPRLAWALFGALAAALALSKVNIGIFALLAIGLMALGTFATTPARRVLLAIAGLVVVASPALLMMSHAAEPSVPPFIILVTAAILPLVVLELVRPSATFMRGNGILWTSCGAAAVTLLFSTFAVLYGTTIRSLVNVLILAPLRHPDVLFRPLELAPYSRELALLAAIVGVAIVLRQHTNAPGLRLAAGLAMWLAAPIFSTRFGFYFAPLAWVATLPVAAVPDSPALAFARRFLPLFAVLQTLHAYPVARSQVQWGAFLLVAVGAICVFDGLRLLGRARLLTLVPLALLLLVATPVVTTLTSARRAYLTNEALALPGADHVRLPAAQVSKLRGVVRVLQERGCETYIGAPGMGSFYFWIRRDPPTGLIGTRWGYLFDRATQEQVVRDLERVDRLCVVERRQILAVWAKDSPVHPSPLADYLLNQFVPVDGDDMYRVYVRRGQAGSYRGAARGVTSASTSLSAHRIASTIMVCISGLSQFPSTWPSVE